MEGFVAKPESVESLKQAIVALLQNQCALQTMGMAARNRVFELSSREIIEGKFRELFTSLVDKKID
ncbi:glycosyltransferase [Rhodopseudomonas parapalustris]